MKTMPKFIDNCTSVFPRTSRCDGNAIYFYPTPLRRRFFFGLIKHGWWVAFLAVLALTGCDEMDSQARTAANLRDALAQAQQDRTDLWTPERIERVGVAAGMVARALPNTVAEVK